MIAAFGAGKRLTAHAAHEGVLGVQDDAVGGANSCLELTQRRVATIGDTDTAAEITPVPGDGILERKARNGGDRQKCEVNPAGERTGVKGGGVARDAEEVLVDLAATACASSAFNAIESLKVLGMQGEEGEPKEVCLRLDEWREGLGSRSGREPFCRRLASGAWLVVVNDLSHTHRLR